MIKFRTEGKVIQNGRILCYKIYIGFYIFYVMPSVYKCAFEKGWLEASNERNLEALNYENFLNTRGKIVNYRITYAIKHATIEALQEALEKSNQEKGYYVIRYEEFGKLIWKIQVDTIHFIANVTKSTEGSGNWPVMKIGKEIPYSYVLDVMCIHLDRLYMNSRHLIDKLNEVDGYDDTMQSCGRIVCEKEVEIL